MSFTKTFRVGKDALRLADIDPADTSLARDKSAAKKAAKADHEAIADLQRALFAEGRQSLLIVLQAPDAGGKDGTIRGLARALNPQGCHVVGFKQPSTRERAHDFLWRVHPHAPQRGGISIFNRSHYEDVLVVRVRKLLPEKVWRKRYDHINAFERLLLDNDTHILKFYLHISKEEQLDRFAKRLTDPAKNWKISEADYTERDRWDEYAQAFEEVFKRCSPSDAPWFVVPSDKKWYRNFVIARIIRETFEGMDIRIPKPTVDLEDIRRRFIEERLEVAEGD